MVDSDEEEESANGSISEDEVGITVSSMVLLDHANNLPAPFSTLNRVPETDFQSSDTNFGLGGLAKLACGCRFI